MASAFARLHRAAGDGQRIQHHQRVTTIGQYDMHMCGVMVGYVDPMLAPPTR